MNKTVYVCEIQADQNTARGESSPGCTEQAAQKGEYTE